ncbi:MAG: hypothetical protein NVS2B17_08980 [Candidatus Velthaea sp.]
MRGFIASACIIAATFAAAPSPAAPPGRSASIVCERTHLYLWSRSQSLPLRTPTSNDALLGQRFTIVSGPRTTPDSSLFYELDIPVVEPGYGPDGHYWILTDCVSVGDAPA